ncbi:MAG: phage/plasmid primase, P4 family [Pseudomonadales bacterium]
MLRYVALWNRWLAWDDRAWREDDTLAVYDRIRAHVRAATASDKDWLKATIIASVERLAKSDRRYAATADQWDRHDWLLNTPTGIADLATGQVHDSDPDAHLTKLTGFGPSGDCPTWRRFLDQVAGGDADYVAFLQRVAGYAATGSIREHALFFLYGSGANGKGTFLNTLQKVLGDYATVSSMETFTESKVDRHTTELAMLRGARLVLAQETEEGRAWAESRIKALTGGDPVTARYMRQDNFTFYPKFKLLIAGNHKPRLRNVDEAMRRRLHLLPFVVTFRGENRDPDLADKLLAEGPGIMRWIVEGALAYQAEGLNPPEVVTNATADYFAGENMLQEWLAERCDLGPDYWEPSSRLFESWKHFAERANEKTGTKKTLGERLEAAGFRGGNTASRGGRHWQGLRLKSEPFGQEA